MASKESNRIILTCDKVHAPRENTNTSDGEKYWSYRFTFSDGKGTEYSHFATYTEYYFGHSGGCVALQKVWEGDKLEAKFISGSYSHFEFYPYAPIA